MFPHIHFSPVCEFLADFVDSHTAKTGLLRRCRSLGPSESAYIHCAYPNPVPLLLAAPLEVHEKNWKCLDVHATGFSVTL